METEKSVNLSLLKNEKSRKKVVVRFSKMDILKMSNFEKVEGSFCRKVILLGDAVKPIFLIQLLLP